MRIGKSFLPLLSAVLVVLAVPALAGVTAANLQKAYEGETTAAAKYAQYAVKADAEGYAGVASLFRAASAAEKVHVKNHLQAMKELGIKPKPLKPKIKVGTTAENLRDALAGETYEATKMYVEMLAAAQKENVSEAVRTFTYALGAEKEHQKLFSQALKSLKKSPKTTYYVCQICGMTLKQMPAVRCPLCGFPKDEYKPVS